MRGSGIALGVVNVDGWVDIYMAIIRESNVLYINKLNSALGAKIQISYTG